VPPSQDSPSRPNLLYLVHRLPFPPDKGDRIRAFQLLRYLSQKAAVHLACLTDEPAEPGALDALSRYCAKVAVIELGPLRWVRAIGSLAKGGTASTGAFSSPQLRAVIRQWTTATPFHACLTSASSLVPYLRLAELRDVPAVVDLVDVDSQKWFDYAAASPGPRAWLYRLEGQRLRRLEAELPAWVRAVTLISDAETALYQSFCADGQVGVVANGVDLDYFQPLHLPDQKGCVFLGALDYRPNVDGIAWFCHEVWPKVRRLLPDAEIHLVGRRPALAVRRLGRLPGVILVGQVPDVRPFLAKAAVSIVPLQIARGVQNKILEAMAMAKATVVSPCCMKGLRAQVGSQLLVASSADEWTQTLVNLLQDQALRLRLGKAAREYVVHHHRWERCLAPLDSLLELPPTSAPSPPPAATNAGPSVAAVAGFSR